MPFKNIAKRLISSAIILSVVLFIIFKGSLLLFLVLVEALALFALYEFYGLVERKNISVNRRLGLLFGATLPLIFYYPGESIILGFVIFALFLINFNRMEGTSAIINVAVTLLGILYVVWFFSFTMKIRCLEYGREWVFFLLAVTKLGDAGAYFVGQKFGKKKLSPSISPHKTVNGAIGGLAASILVALFSKAYLPHVETGHLLLLGLVLGILAQIGDLVESMIKRDVDVKDSGSLPGLGGVLDMLDSLLFTAPFLYFYLTAVLI